MCIFYGLAFQTKHFCICLFVVVSKFQWTCPGQFVFKEIVPSLVVIDADWTDFLFMAIFQVEGKERRRKIFEGMHSDLLLNNEWPIYRETENAKAIPKQNLKKKMDETTDSTTNWIWNTIHVLLNRWLTQRQDFKCLQLTSFFFVIL